MLHFIPAWYRPDTWHENEQKWYIRREHTEFDDTVKQVQLFHRNEVYPYQILLLGYSPNFRHFLHRQGVFHAPYWSCFDAIQEIMRKKAVPLSFHNLKWPAYTEFEYTPFVVTAFLKGEKYAQIEFGEDGNPIEIDMYKGGVICRRNIYDDRGFVSGTLLYKDGQPYYQDYLMENGIWKLRCFQNDGHVEVNPKYPEYRLFYQDYAEKKTFTSLRYDSLEQVIREVLQAYLELTREQDMFCIAMDERHAGLLKEVLKGRKTILSFFGNRYDFESHPLAARMASMADCVITDSQEHSEKIQSKAGDAIWKITDISPYDTRVDFGISQQLELQKILVPVDGIREEDFKLLIVTLAGYLKRNDTARVHLFTRQAEWDKKTRILEQVRIFLKENGFIAEWGKEEKEEGLSENDIDREGAVQARFIVEQCVDELSVSKCMREQRILVDIRKSPALYLQIMAISVGIPQIVCENTQFVEDHGNGLILQNLCQLPDSLAYYLDGLSNWNNAKIHAFEMGKKFSSEVLINKWKEVIDFVG